MQCHLLRISFILFFGLSVACSSDGPRDSPNLISDPNDGGTSVEDDAGLDAGDAADFAVDGGDDAGDAGERDLCVPETPEEMCERYEYECGPLENVDNCGETRMVQTCGDPAEVCEDPDSCGGGGQEGQCGCTPTTCEAEGLLCGVAPDGCLGEIMCDAFCVDSVSAGGSHACAIGSGAIKCWGSGSGGQLGNDATGQQNNPVDVVWPADDVPTVLVAGPGDKHTCAVSSAGRVFCWGANGRGQLGVGTTVNSKMPGTPAVGAGATAVVSGVEHSCAIVDEAVWCWGSNDYGQVGNPSFNYGSNVAVATEVTGLEANVVEIAAGAYHTCAIVDDPADGSVNGDVYCWGRGHYGQLGHLDETVELDSMADHDVATRSVAIHLAFSGAVEISAGETHTCVVDANDGVQCWGTMALPRNAIGCTIDGKNPARCAIWPESGSYIGKLNSAGDAVQTYFVDAFANQPTPVYMEKTASGVGSGNNHACFLVDPPEAGESNIRCLGANTFGQLGDGTNNHWPVPTRVFLDTNNEVVVGTQISLGNNFSCALVSDSNVKCWGSNANGQIGNSALMRDETYKPFDVKLEPM